MRDSGAGGLTVARCIRRLLPHATLLYFADTAHVPYGDRTPAEVCHYALSIADFLIEQGAAMVVFACNTSSAYALPAAHARFDVPIFGMNEPGARAALEYAAPGETIGVLATQATVDSGIYTRWLQKLRPGTASLEIACPRFVPLVEAEQTTSAAARRACAAALQPLRENDVRTVILGCTHYPLLLPVLQEIAPEMRFVDPAEAVAQQVAQQVAPCATQPEYSASANDVFYISGETRGVRHWITRLLSIEKPLIRRGPVFDLPVTKAPGPSGTVPDLAVSGI